MHSQQNVGFNDSYMAAHRFDRRMAVIDRFYLTSVTNRAFNDYFGNATYGCITEFVNPDEKESFIEFIDGFSGEETEKCFLLKNSDGEYRLNLVKLTAFEGEPVLRNIDIEMVDIDSFVEVNYRICDDISRERVIMGLTGEYVFTYSELTGDIKIVRYEASSREVIVRLPLDEWREYMADGRVAMEDMVELDSLINCIRTYMSDFCVKLTTSMRTLGKVMEKVKFIGTVYTKYTGENIVTGRIVLADGVNSMGNIVEVVDELTMDSLTKVYNKKTITEYASRLVKQDTVNRISIAILDIDYFKQVNDRYGHLYGDKVLTRVAKKLKEVVGEDGVVGRIGGDEFMIVLKGINDDYALRGILRAIRTQVKWEFKNDYENFQVTTSIGVAFSPNNGHDYEELFKKADFCLYVAKEKGRDRYVFFRDDLHKESYENSLNVKDKNVNDGREMKELRFLSGIMEEFAQDRRKAVDELLHHMYDSFKLDSINLYRGHNLSRTYYIGVELGGSMNAGYVNTEEFRKLLGGKNHVAVGFVGRQTDIAPEFGMAMREKRVFSTVQCIVGTQNNVKGIFTIDRCKESSQWAEYEIEMAVVAASLINIIAESENN